MRTHSGQCRSLPMYYKVLAEAIGAEACLSFAPQHLFIRHRDEMDPNKWVNVELTTRSLSREVFYIERFGITDNAIRNKVYMYPLTDRETVAFLMSEMLMLGYLRKYDYAYDDLMWLCATKSEEYYPQNVTALQIKANCINTLLMKHLESNGYRMDEEARRLDDWWYKIRAEIEALGWSEMDYDLYEKLLRDTWDSMKKDGVDEETIRSEMNRENRSPIQYITN